MRSTAAAATCPSTVSWLASDLSTYDIMNCSNLVFVDNAHEVIEGMLK